MLRRLAFLIPLALLSPASAAPTVEVTATRVEVDQSPSISVDYLFEVGEATFKKDAAALLDEVAKALVKEGKSSIIIDVHSDDNAPDGDRTGAYLHKLTQARAEAIKNYLVKKGVPIRRMTSRGRGPEAPMTSNRTDDGRRSNRRVEMTVEIEIRPPVAADLAMYLKAIKSTGPLLMAKIETSAGTLNCTLFEERTPITVANFVGLATGQKAWVDPKTTKTVKGKPFYDGLTFHRAMPGFMIQAGDPLGNGNGGPGYEFADEIHRDLRNKAGTLAMANRGPRTNGSQFFINEVHSTHLDGTNTVFGECRETELVTKIANTGTRDNDRPKAPIVIRKVTIARTAQAPTPPPAPPVIGPKPR